MVTIEKEKDQPTFEEVQELFAVWRNQKKRHDPIRVLPVSLRETTW